MQRLICLGFEGTPAAELLQGTGALWCERMGHIAPERLAYAFDQVEAHATRWPTPAQIMDMLPAYAHVVQTAPPTSPTQIPVDPEQAKRSEERIRRMIDGIAAKLGVTP